MKQRGPIFVGVIGAVVAVLMLLVLVMPKVSQIHKTRDDLALAKQQQASLETQLEGLKATEQRAKAIRTELDLLDAAVPTQADEPDLIRMLNDIADQAGVTFMSVAPGTPTTVAGGTGALSVGGASTGTGGSTDTGVPSSPSPSPTESTPPAISIPVGQTLPQSISVLPASISVDGSYFALDEYLFRLESLPRISKVVSITLAPGQDSSQLTLTLNVNFYTTDVSSGPGSQPGAQDGSAVNSIGSVPLPGASPTPSASPAA